MMAWRPHEAENIFSSPGGVQGIEGSGCGRTRVTRDAFVGWRFAVKILRLAQAREMFRRMGTEDLRVGHGAWRGPIQFQLGLITQPFEGGDNAQWAFGMADARVTGAVLVGNYPHERSFARMARQKQFFVFTIAGRSLKLSENYLHMMNRKWFALAAALGGFIFNAGAWDYEGHHAINELALASLPSDFGGFALTPAMKGRIEFLAGEPDRWRNTTDLPLKHVNGPDHYIDLEEITLYGLTPDTLPLLRYDFVADIARARAEHPERFPAIDPTRDSDHTRELTGFLPWSITENYAKLKSCFSYLKTFEKYGGTDEEIANARADVIYVMGVMGHYVGDGSQPLHTTTQFNGWVGDNPHGFTTNTTFHAWIDGGFFRKTGPINVEPLIAKIHPAVRIPNADKQDGVFRAVVAYIVAQNKLVEPLYELQKEGKLTGEGGTGMEGQAFLYGQLVKGGQMLGDIWYSAWLEAPEDHYLQMQLQQRANANPGAK
jgi:hypothetical protein